MKLKWIQQFIMCIGFLPLAGLTEENRLAGIFPERIRTIALVAPASPGSSTQKVDRGIALLEKSGIRVKTMPNARIGEPAGYTSIPVGKRVADLVHSRRRRHFRYSGKAGLGQTAHTPRSSGSRVQRHYGSAHGDAEGKSRAPLCIALAAGAAERGQ